MAATLTTLTRRLDALERRTRPRTAAFEVQQPLTADEVMALTRTALGLVIFRSQMQLRAGTITPEAHAAHLTELADAFPDLMSVYEIAPTPIPFQRRDDHERATADERPVKRVAAV